MDTLMQVVALIASLLLACIHSDARQILADGPVSVKYYPGKNLDAKLLILDVNSIYFKGNHPYFYGMNGPDTDTAEKCFLACARTTGCNGFVSCPERKGCGKGCKAYVKAHKKLPSDDMTANYIHQKLPLTGFGEWTYPSYFLDGCVNTTTNGVLTTGDKWNWGLCSLKYVKDLKHLNFFKSTTSSPQDGFVSGVLKKPDNCPSGLPYAVCGECNALKASSSRAKCLSCAKALKVNNPIKEATSQGGGNYYNCPKCFGPGKDADKCIQCVKDKGQNGDAYACIV